MDAGELVGLRRHLGLSQTEMAGRIGLALRAYQDIENGRAKLRRVHVLAVERAALAIAAERGEVALAPDSVRKDISAMLAMMAGKALAVKGG
jgi:DNA-binding XRE family transcriptional regulator